MLLILTFAVTLLVAAPLAGIARRTFISTSVIFLLAGLMVGPLPFATRILGSDSGVVGNLAEAALFATLLTGGMRASYPQIVAVKGLAGRALFLAMPVTAVAIALFARFLGDLAWLPALLVGVILSPTDPVMASAILERKEVPKRLRKLLNVESGINDGLVLPVVLLLLEALREEPLKPVLFLGELLLGIAVGVGIAWIGVRLHRLESSGPPPVYEPFSAFAIGIAVFATSKITHANEFLAAFSAGVTIASLSPELQERFEQFGGRIAELLKEAAILVFAALVSASIWPEFTGVHVVFGLLTVVLARPAGLLLSMLGTSLDTRSRLGAAWFGPKGFASVVYGLFVLRSGIADAKHLFSFIAAAVCLSILAHGSTDVLTARGFEGREGKEEEED